MSPTPGIFAPLSPPPGLAHSSAVLERRYEYSDVVTTESQRQGRATLHFVTAYQWIICAIVGLLTLRNIILITARRNRAWKLVYEKIRNLNLEKKHGKEVHGYAQLEHRPTTADKIDRVLFYPLSAAWYWGGLENPLQVLICVALFAINTGFVLAVAIKFNDTEDAVWNHIHVVALRCGFMSMAQFPAIFALTGRNSVVQFLTGIEYQHLRFVHKVMACWMGLLGCIHTIDATIAHSDWYGMAGVRQLYTTDPLGITGLVMLVGLFFIGVFSIRRVRMRHYECFLFFHVLGAFMMLVGIILHVPALAKWIYGPIAFWAFERLARIVQLCSVHLLCKFQFRAPLVKARATLIEGAIVLRVPFKGKWEAGQHAYISIWDTSFMRTPWVYNQTHPFSIANVPSASEVDDSGKVYEMLFVMRTRDGMTNQLATQLAKSSSGTKQIWITVEGPYGDAVDTEQFSEILFVAGGSGITHIMSMLGDVIHKARVGFARASRLRVIWTVQNIEQSIWTLTELLNLAAQAAEAGVELHVELYVTRGMSNPKRKSIIESSAKDLPSTPRMEELNDENTAEDLDQLMNVSPMADALTIIGGRPHISGLVPAFVAGAEGKSLVVGCGPGPMMMNVRKEVNKLVQDYPVQLEIALFEC